MGRIPSHSRWWNVGRPVLSRSYADNHNSRDAMAVFGPPAVILLHISWFFCSLSSLRCSLSLGGCDTAVLFRIPYSTIIYFWLFGHSMGFCSNFHRGYFLFSPSPLSSLSLFPSPSSLLPLLPTCGGQRLMCAFLCICQPYYLLFNIIYYCDSSLKEAASPAPTDPSAVNWLNCHWLWRVWNVISPYSNHLRPFSALWEQFMALPYGWPSGKAFGMNKLIPSSHQPKAKSVRQDLRAMAEIPLLCSNLLTKCLHPCICKVPWVTTSFVLFP